MPRTRSPGIDATSPSDPGSATGSRGSAATRYVFDRASVRAVDRAAIEEYGIPGIVLMENAARALARQVERMMEGAAAGRCLLIVAGSGNNGGDGWALARHADNAGMRPVVAALGEPRPESDAGTNAAICRKMGIAEVSVEDLDAHRDADLVVDAIFGTGLARPITGQAADVVTWINDTGRPVLAVDLPSGMDCDTGQTLGVCVTGQATVSFVGLKRGFLEPAALPFLGQVSVGDIGVPRALVERFGCPFDPDG